ncbi:unnamed protein product [Effrenium voratum]|nr:unnamed protein product [Effrenium voratum]CAJ1429432.1 unnamed protein product [Effrenium voratum]
MLRLYGQNLLAGLRGDCIYFAETLLLPELSQTGKVQVSSMLRCLLQSRLPKAAQRGALQMKAELGLQPDANVEKDHPHVRSWCDPYASPYSQHVCMPCSKWPESKAGITERPEISIEP